MKAIVRWATLTAALAVCFSWSAHAQSGASSNIASTQARQAEKAQRKADRKAHRARSTAELGALEKNGYKPGGGRADYPQDVQNAEAKVNSSRKGNITPAASEP